MHKNANNKASVNETDDGIVGFGNGACHNKENKTKEYYKTHEVERRDNESSSNHWQRQRQSIRHPFFVAAGSGNNFLILDWDPKSAEQLPVITSAAGHKYMYDEQSIWWLRLDKELVKAFLLREHRLKKLHARLIAQHDMIQNVFINKRFSNGSNDLRLSGSEEFKIAATAAEYLRLVIRVRQEKNAFRLNNTLIEDDPNKSDYQQGEWNNPYEKRSRLPRFVSSFLGKFCNMK